MWQLFSLLGMFTSALENSFDKHSLLKENNLDYAVTTFYRILVYTLIVCLVGLFGWSGGLHIFLDWKIVVFGIIGAFIALSYTYVLKRIEVTNIGTISYVGPALFLLIDTAWLRTPLSSLQVLGVALLIIGGIGFSIDGVTRKMKKELSLQVFSVFIFWLIYGGTEAYFFKFMYITENMNATTFFANIWAWSTITLLLLVLVQRKIHLLFSVSAKRFITGSIFSKICDASSTLFRAEALTLASVSQVSSMGALSPLILFFVTFLVQGVFHFPLDERLDKTNLIWKGIMVLLLVVGSFSVR